ncbi:LysR family transcriptional regulator [Ideonella oryzae]|uniref:LysR family transcriptional regulator n=1 Tax=Ideonella oryzae TaxID=2937441 RepID=A0ABT1BGX1_9BURK|nr:LysR family transcriptional regulator [Ideonella oryzae]MCO5975328.1 LysR family transcriptional regulator [Ideonella oryzae]
MRLRHIEVFHAIMQAGSVSGAAQLLHISQPAVTKVLQHCELQLGMPLFERTPGKLHPTPEAHRLFTEVDRLHRDLLGVRRLAANLRTGQAERVRIGITPSLGVDLLPEALVRWRKLAPHTPVDLSTNHTTEIVSALLSGDIDLGLSLQNPHHPGLRAEALASSTMMALCPVSSPEARQAGPLPISDITSELIGLGDDDPMGHAVMNLASDGEAAPQPLVTVKTYQLARALVESGMGLSLVDPFTAASAHPQRIRVRRLTPAVPVQLYLLTLAKAPLGLPARKLVRVLGDVAQESLARLP